MSTTFEIGRMPGRQQARREPQRRGPDRHVLEHARGEARAEVRALDGDRDAGRRAVERARVGAATAAARAARRSRRAPRARRRRRRGSPGGSGVISSSSTSVPSGSTLASGVPGGGPSSSTRMPAWSPPSAISSVARIIPSLTMPRSFAAPSVRPSASRAPGRATATVWPAATFGAPQTIVAGSRLADVDRADAQAVGVGVLRRPRAPARRRSARPPAAPWRNDALDLGAGQRQPRRELLGRERRVAVLAQPFERDEHQRRSELLEEAHVVVEVQAQVGDAVAQHRDPLDAHPEREAGDALGVVAVLAHVLEDVRVDHAGAEDLEPARALAQRAARAVGEHAARRS